MGLFKAIIKNVALAAAVIVGKRVWTKVAGSDSKKASAAHAKAPVKAAAKPSPSAKPKAPAKTAASSATKPKAAAKPKAPAKPRAAAKPKAEVAVEAPATPVKTEPASGT